MLTFDRYREEITAQTAALADAITGVDLTTGVPTCPKWNLDKLVRHVGGAHRWAASMIEQRATEPVPFERQTTDDHASYLREGAARLVAALADAGPQAAVWTWTGEGSSGYWARRMTYETAVHRADAELALGRPYDLAPDLAADGITESLELVFVLRAGGEGLHGKGEVLRFAAPDAGEWLVRLNPGGPELMPDTTAMNAETGAGPDVTVTGPVTDLLLVLLRRLPPERVHVSGRADLFSNWLTETAF